MRFKGVKYTKIGCLSEVPKEPHGSGSNKGLHDAGGFV